MLEKKRRVCRLIRPANPSERVNIYSQFTRRTTNDGLVKLGTVISLFCGWQVEIIDEENYRGPIGRDGLPDHEALQKDCPAEVVGIYCGLTSTMDRAWQLAEFYKTKNCIILAGSWHAHYLPDETLHHNMDLVVHGAGEAVIEKIFENIDNSRPIYQGVGGVSYLEGETVKHIFPDLQDAGQIPDCDPKLIQLENRLTNKQKDNMPYEDFGLLSYAKMVIYPIGRICGCSMGCKFCAVKTKPYWASPEWLFGLVDHLVKTRKAKTFFIVDDRMEEDLPGTIKFFEMVAKKYGRKLSFNVQMRLGAAKNKELLFVMKKAGVRSVCIGLESPIDEELRAMKKGLTVKVMVELIRVWRRYGIKVHGMFIFGFPVPGLKLTIAERVKIYKKFIKWARLDFIQVLLPIPLPGSELYLENRDAGKLFPLSVAGWNKYDGNFLLFKLDEGLDMREFQNAHFKIMKWFYSPFSFYKVVYRTLTFPIDFLVRGFDPWKSDWGREVILWIGHNIVNRWIATRESEKHIESLKNQK